MSEKIGLYKFYKDFVQKLGKIDSDLSILKEWVGINYKTGVILLWLVK